MKATENLKNLNMLSQPVRLAYSSWAGLGLARFGSVWLGLARFGLAGLCWAGLDFAGLGLAWLGVV